MFGDKIYVISMPSRVDRREQCNLQALQNNLDITFIDAVDGNTLNLKKLLDEGIVDKKFFDPHGTCCTMGTYGCSLSHMKAWKQAYEDGVETALFLEDDFFFTPFKEWKDLIIDKKEYIMNVDWDVLFLGKHRRYIKGHEINDLMVRTKEDWLDTDITERMEDTGLEYWGAHAYLARRNSIKFFIDNYFPVNMGADVWLQYQSRMSDLNIYTLKETFIWQKTSLLLHNLAETKPLTPQEVNNLNDSDTFHNLNKKGKLKWVQMPKFAKSCQRGEKLWEFNIGDQ